MADKIKYPNNIYTGMLVFSFCALVGATVYTAKMAHSFVGNPDDPSGMAPMATCWTLINPDKNDHQTENTDVKRVVPDPSKPAKLALVNK